METELGNSYKTVLIQPGNSKESVHGTCADSFKVYPLRWRCGEGCDEAQQMYINQLQTMPSLQRACHIQTGSLQIMGRQGKPPLITMATPTNEERERERERVQPTVRPYQL